MSDIPVGSVRFGDLRRLSPIRRDWGYGDGLPIGRYYIEKFLERNADVIRGRVLEVANNNYTTRFGGARVERSDVLTIEGTSPRATITGDIANKATLPAAAFDCIIFTQTLYYVYDVCAAIATIYHGLKPGGTLLLTTPGLAPMADQPGCGKPNRWPWYWLFTPAAVTRLLAECFGAGAITVETQGNILAVTACLHGLVAEEFEAAELDFADEQYPLNIAARAIKPLDQAEAAR